MGGFDRDLVMRAAEAARAGNARLTAAGGITTAEDVAWLDRKGVDAQVGMALYTGRLTLAAAVVAVLRGGEAGGTRWPTVVCDEEGQALGLVWSTGESLEAAMRERRGVYWSRSRRALWRKGEVSGAAQDLLRVELDCDRDAVRFVVRQAPPGFCHTGAWTCWGSRFSPGALERTVRDRIGAADPGSGTARLLADPALLGQKLVEEARELASAVGSEAAVHEAADLLYFALVRLAREGGTLRQVTRELERRAGRVTRRPMIAKPERPS